jgi:galactokinase
MCPYMVIITHSFSAHWSGVSALSGRHVVAEIARTQEAKSALQDSDFARFGELMNESHDSLSVDFQVSCDELDECVEIARRTEGVLGSRMSGGGFGGCTVTLVQAAHADTLLANFATKYSGYEEGAAFKTAPGAGAGAFWFPDAPAVASAAQE